MSSGDYDNDKDAAIKKRLLSDASDVLTEEQEAAKAAADKSRALVWSFIAMVVVGLGNKIFQPLQMVPMYVLAPLPCVAACARSRSHVVALCHTGTTTHCSPTC